MFTIKDAKASLFSNPGNLFKNKDLLYRGHCGNWRTSNCSWINRFVFSNPLNRVASQETQLEQFHRPDWMSEDRGTLVWLWSMFDQYCGRKHSSRNHESPPEELQFHIVCTFIFPFENFSFIFFCQSLFPFSYQLFSAHSIDSMSVLNIFYSQFILNYGLLPPL